MDMLIQNDTVPFTLNGRDYTFDVRSYLNKLVSEHVGHDCRTYYYYRFKASFRLEATKYGTKYYGPMYVELLSDEKCGDDLARALNDHKYRAFKAATQHALGNYYDEYYHSLYLTEVEMIEHRTGSKLNPRGIITEVNDVIRVKNIPKLIPWNEEQPGEFAAEITDCEKDITAIVGFHDPKRVWCMIVSRENEDKTIHDLIPTIEFNETYYALHEASEFISGRRSPDPHDEGEEMVVKGLN